MFKFFYKSKIELINKLREISLNGSEQFFNYLKSDSLLYNKCINDNPLKNTGVLFILNIYRDILNSRYDAKEVFLIMTRTIISFSQDNKTTELFLKTFNEYIQACNQSVEYCKGLPNFDISTVLTKVFFGLVIDDKEFLVKELDGAISQSDCYIKIYNYINVICLLYKL